MTLAEITSTARAFARSRGGLAGNDAEVGLFVDQAALAFSVDSGGIYYSTEYEVNRDTPPADRTRRVPLESGYYTAHSVYFIPGTGSYYGILRQEDLRSLLNPNLDRISVGWPVAYAVTPDDDNPVMVLSSRPDPGELLVNWWGRLRWQDSALEYVDTPASDSTPAMLPEFHLALAHKAAALIAETNFDHEVARLHSVAYEAKVALYNRVATGRAGNNGIYIPREPFPRTPFANAVRYPRIG